MTPQEAYEQITTLAREHALVIEGFGGIVTICHPDTQREEGIFCRIQWMHGKGTHPDKEDHCRCRKEGKGVCSRSGNDHS